MYKCVECGHIFDEGEQVSWGEHHGFIDGVVEHMSGCPICRGSFHETTSCTQCGGEFLEDELYPGNICKQCLLDSINLNTGLEYLSDGLESDFYFRFWLESSVEKASARLLDIVKNAYSIQSIVAPEKSIKQLIAYIAEKDSDLYDYAEWLKGNGVSND